MNKQKLIEHSKIIEKELLGIIINNPQKTIRAAALVSVEDFYNYAKVYATVTDCFLNEKNLVTEFGIKKIKVSDFIEDSFRDISRVCKELKEVSNAIRLYDILQKATENITHENTEQYVSEIQREIINGVTSVEKESTSISQIIAEWRERREMYVEKFKNGNKIIGTSTGYDKIDAIIDGLRPEHLWIIGGYTNVGKTAASLNIVANLIAQGKRVVYFSIEMAAVDIVSRLLGIMTKESGLSIVKGFGDKELIEEKILKLIKSNLSIHTTKSSLSEIQFSMYEENIKQKVDLFVVDFVQLVTVNGAKSEYETITTSALEFQQMAKRLKAPIILLSQISNEGAKNGNEVVMSFKGSGALAAAADFAIEITIAEDDAKEWKRKMHNGEKVRMKWNVRKNRHGKVGYVEMLFEGKTGIFEQALTIDEF